MVIDLLQPEEEGSRNQPFEKKTLTQKKMGNRIAIMEEYPQNLEAVPHERTI